MDYKVPLVMTPQPKGGYTVTSPLLPELITEGDSIRDATENVKDALAAAARTAISGWSVSTSTWSSERRAKARHMAPPPYESQAPWSSPAASSMTVYCG